MKQTSKSARELPHICGSGFDGAGFHQLRDELVLANGRLGLWLLGWLLIVWSLQQIIRPIGPHCLVTGANHPPQSVPRKI